VFLICKKNVPTHSNLYSIVSFLLDNKNIYYYFQFASKLQIRINSRIIYMKKLLVIGITLLICLSGVYASGKKEIKSDKPLISVSIVPEYTFVKKIVGDKMDVLTLVGKGSSPEDYELTPKERAAFESSDIYFSIGVSTESLTIIPFVDDDTKVVSLSDEVEKVYPALQIGTSRDPHIWMSPKRVIVMVKTITEEVSKLDEANREYYEENSHLYIEMLTSLDEYISSYLSDLANREFIVYHPAFGYFADDYNLKCIVIEEEGKEATAKSLANLVSYAKEKSIKNIFYQAEIAEAQSSTIANELGGKSIQLNPLAANYIDNLKETAVLIKGNI
jgi:zinc transport system substrate-binding protein